MPLRGLEGTVVVVTGGGSGIGRAIVERLLEERVRVVVMDVDGERVARVLDELGADRVLAVEGDVASLEDFGRCFEQALAAFGRVDGLVNDAGTVAPREPLAEIDPAHFDRVFDVNVRGTFLGMRTMIAHAAATASAASIVNLASGLGLRGAPNSGFYAASKAAIISLTRTAALEAAPAGVRVNALVPGPVDTPLFARHPQATRDLHISAVPLGRLAAPDELAAAAAWLLSAESSFVTGTELRIDGGEAA